MKPLPILIDPSYFMQGFFGFLLMLAAIFILYRAYVGAAEKPNDEDSGKD